MASSVEVRQNSEKEIGMELTCQEAKSLPPGVLVHAVYGQFFFGTMENIEQKLAQTRTDPRILIIRLRRVPFMNISGLQALEKAILNLEARGIRIVLCEANERVREKLDKAGVLAVIEPEDYFDDFATAVARCDSLVGSSSQIAHEPQVILSEYAESFLMASESYLRDAQNSSGE
jgi:SulP family sulfate permease